MEKPITCIGKRTRSNTRHRVLSTHRQTSELHRAISLRDKNRVMRIIQKGEKLCNGVGINCFILAQSVCNWDFVQYLLSVDPHAGVRAKNYEGQTLLMLYTKSHKLREAQLMLEHGADANDCSNDGTTALMLTLQKWYFEPSRRSKEYNFCDSNSIIFYRSHRRYYQDIVNLLLQRGADVNSCKIDGENVLHFAVKNFFTFYLEMFRTLIDAGVDPTTENREHCTVLTYAMETFIGMCLQFNIDTIMNEVYPALSYLLDLAPFQRDTFQLHCPEAMHPQTILLKHLSVCQMLTQNIEIFTDLIGNNKNLMDSELVVLDYFQNRSCYLDDPRLERTELPFGPLAHYLNYEQAMPVLHSEVSYRYNPIENLQYLLSIGFTVNTPSYATLSPLTVGLLNGSLYCSHPDEYETFTRFMMANGAHVEQRLLIYMEQDEELEQLSDALCLPDVLRVTLTQTHLMDKLLLKLLEMFLPHFAHPPLALLPFARFEIVSKLFPFLSSYGPLYHSPLHKTVKQRIVNTQRLSEEELHTFNSMNNSIPLLQELCRTAVRAHLAPRASQHGNSLPGLIREIQPLAPGLRDLLLNVT